jgi:quinol-cytochrome oxidoreductase complex cytochrome b subunit
VGPAIFYYIFQPPTIDPTYPFLRSNFFLTAYVGASISQDIYGGVLFQIPSVLLLGFLPRLSHQMKKSHGAQFAILLVAISVITVIVDAQMGGILQRYICDFQLWLVIASITVYFHLKEKVCAMESGETVLHRSACLVLLASIAFSTMLVMTTRPITEFFDYLFWL